MCVPPWNALVEIGFMSSAPALVPVDLDAPAAANSETVAVVRHLAHELRQPLSTIESIAYYLEMVLPRADRKTRVQLEKLQQLVHQTNWILADALHYLQANPLQPALIDLTEMVLEATGEVSAEVQPFRIDVKEALPLVLMDPGQAQHLIRNLLHIFSRMGSQAYPLAIRGASTFTHVRLEFESRTSEPHSEADLLAMLEPFAPHAPAGFGLSLASARRIVEAHGGEAELFSTPGGAVTFLIKLPRGI